MKHSFETKVYYADTDAYGVVWHGAYLRWLERGRVDLCNELGLDLVTMKQLDVLLPVTNMNVKYKASARLKDNLIIETWIEKCNSLSVTFKQTIKTTRHCELDSQSQKCDGNAISEQVRNDASIERLCIEATFDVVAVNEAGKLYRKMPVEITEKLMKGLEKCPACV